MTPYLHEIGALLVLGAGAMLVFRSLRRISADGTNTLELLDLITENGRMSKYAVLMWVGVGVTSWIVVYLTMTEKLSDGIFIAYCAQVVAPAVTKNLSGSPSPRDDARQPAPQNDQSDFLNTVPLQGVRER